MSRKPAAPSGITARAKRVWTRTLDEYELREDEVALLADLVREMTTVDRLESALEDANLLARGSNGGTIANPLLTELRLHRGSIVQLHKALKLPDLDAPEQTRPTDEAGNVRKMTRSESGRYAAQVRWSRKGGTRSA